MYNTKISDLQHRILIQQKVSSTDSDNIPIEIWDDFITARSKIYTKNSFEKSISNGISIQNTKVFKIRYPKGSYIDIVDTTKYRLLYSNKIYNILCMNNINEKNEWLEIIGELLI